MSVARYEGDITVASDIDCFIACTIEVNLLTAEVYLYAIIVPERDIGSAIRVNRKTGGFTTASLIIATRAVRYQRQRPIRHIIAIRVTGIKGILEVKQLSKIIDLLNSHCHRDDYLGRIWVIAINYNLTFVSSNRQSSVKYHIDIVYLARRNKTGIGHDINPGRLCSKNSAV